MPGSLVQNGVAERRNRTLIYMVRSMLSSSKLPKSLWTKNLKMAAYILNRVQTKAIPNTPFKFSKCWKLSLHHIHVCGCPYEVRVYNPQEKKLDLRTISGYFIGYAKRSKGYRFYCLSHNTKIMESRNSKFLKNELISGSDQSQDLVSMRDQPSTSSDRLVAIYNAFQVQPDVEQRIIEDPQVVDDFSVDEAILDIPEINEQLVEQHNPLKNVDSTLIRSTKERKSAIPSDYVVYLQEFDFTVGAVNNLETFSQAMICKEPKLCHEG